MYSVKNIAVKTPLLLKVVSLYVAIAGQLWLVNYYIDRTQPTINTQAAVIQTIPQQPAQEYISGQPSKLTIDRLNINLDVREGNYDATNNEWTLSDDAAFFASMTTAPNNQSGNTFIYGHNTVAVLEPVKDIEPGDHLTVTTTNGRVFTYLYTHDVSVTPNQTDVLNPTSEKPQLTLMTCQGIFSETRRIMHFEFAGVA